MPAPSGPQKWEHVLSGIPQRVRWLPPFTPGPADLDGRLVHHAVAVLGEQEGEDNFVTLRHLVVTSRGQSVLRMQEEGTLTVFSHTGKMTDLQVCELGGGEAGVVMGTTEGCLHVLRLGLPRHPGADPGELTALPPPPAWPGAVGPGGGADGDEGCLPTWVRPHRGAVAAVDMQQETKNILSVGADGNLFVLDVERVSAAAAAAAGDADGDGMAVDGMEDDAAGQRRGGGAAAAAGGGLPPGVSPYKAGSGCVSYTCGRWLDRSLFVTSRTGGGLETWDIRCPPAPVSRSRREWGATGMGPDDRGCHSSIYSLRVHPSRPDVCASGGSGGGVALWDLRAAGRPLALARADPAAGPVWEVHFDTREAGQQAGAEPPTGGATSPLPAVLFCTEDGALCRVSADAAAPPSSSSSFLTAAAAAAATSEGGGSFFGGPQPGLRRQELSWGVRQSAAGAGAGVGEARGSRAVLAQLPVAINSFDVGGPFGGDVVAVTGRQTLLYMSPQ